MEDCGTQVRRYCFKRLEVRDRDNLNMSVPDWPDVQKCDDTFVSINLMSLDLP